MKMNYVDTSKLDVCEHLENSFKIILDDYLTFNFNFIKNDKFDENFKLFKFAHEAGLYMAEMRDAGSNWKNANFRTYKKSHSWYAMQVSNCGQHLSYSHNKNNIWEGVLLSTKDKNNNLKNTPIGDKFFLKTIDALKDTGVESIMLGKLPSGKSIPPHRGDKGIRRIHLGLIVPEGDVTFTCRGEDRKWEAGKCLAFNDFFEHSARNNTEQDRINLIVDIIR